MGAAIYGNLTIGGWRDKLRDKCERKENLSSVDCGHVSNLLDAMSVERIEDGRTIVERSRTIVTLAKAIQGLLTQAPDGYSASSVWADAVNAINDVGDL